MNMIMRRRMRVSQKVMMNFDDKPNDDLIEEKRWTIDH